MSVAYFQFVKLKDKHGFDLAGASEEIYKQCQTKISALPYYSNHQFRKNGVMCLDIMFVSDIDKYQLNAWQLCNRTWATDFFVSSINIGENTLQNDAQYEHHIYIVPLSPRGAVSCDWYCGGKDKLRRMHASYKLVLENTLNGITIASSKVFYQNLNKAPGHNPFEEMSKPVLSDYKDPEEYQEAVNSYIDHITTKYENKLQDLKGQSSAELNTANKMLTKENVTLNKYLQPFIDLTERYGGVTKMQQMLDTSQLLQYAIRIYQEDGDHDSMQNLQQMLDDGRRYMLRHGLSQNK